MKASKSLKEEFFNHINLDNTESVLSFINNGFDFKDAIGYFGLKPLNYAAVFNKFEIVKLLLDHGVNPETCFSKGKLAIHYASMNGCIDALRILIKNGCNLNAIDSDNNTPQVYAIRYNQNDALNLLYESGVDINPTNTFGYSLIHYAATNNKFDAIKIITNKIKSSECDQTKSIFGKNDDGLTPANFAAANDHLEIFAYFIDNGCDINHKDRSGWNYIQCCAHHGSLQVLNYLAVKFNWSTELSLHINDRTNDGSTAAFIAAKNGQFEVLKLLLHYGASYNIPTNQGQTILDVLNSKLYEIDGSINEKYKNCIRILEEYESGNTIKINRVSKKIKTSMEI